MSANVIKMKPTITSVSQKLMTLTKKKTIILQENSICWIATWAKKQFERLFQRSRSPIKSLSHRRSKRKYDVLFSLELHQCLYEKNMF